MTEGTFLRPPPGRYYTEQTRAWTEWQKDEAVARCEGQGLSPCRACLASVAFDWERMNVKPPKVRKPTVVVSGEP